MLSTATTERRPPRTRYTPPSAHKTLQRDELFDPELPSTVLGRAPQKLYVAGDLELLHAPHRVSIVGARQASELGQRRAAKLAAKLAARNVVVISGLARGIDQAAHRAAISVGGRTIAVIGTPLDRCYPNEHAPMQEEIYRHHLLVSQFRQGSKIYPSNFAARNRVMAMLSHASVIVEAQDSSGTLSQAAEMKRLGRPLFIMRNIVENPELTWPRSFLKSGAVILDDVQQILDVLNGAAEVQAHGVQQLPLHRAEA